MSDLIPVVSGQINGRPALVVDARELHTLMGIAAKFQDWIARRIEDYGFSQDIDYVEILKIENNAARFGGQMTIKEFRLTLGMAKELAMLERPPYGELQEGRLRFQGRQAGGQPQGFRQGAKIRDGYVEPRVHVHYSIKFGACHSTPFVAE